MHGNHSVGFDLVAEMKELQKLLEDTQRNRRYYQQLRDNASTPNERQKHMIEAAACAIREAALKDAIEAVKRES